MQTEELARRHRPRETHGVSPALEDLAPPPWHLTDSRGRPVSLSSAGYVLIFGNSYELWVGPVSEADMPEIRMAVRPTFVTPPTGPEAITKHGQSYRRLSFRVQPAFSWWRVIKAPYEILGDDLEVECRVASGSERQPSKFLCPLVARKRWTVGILVLVLMGGLAGWIINQLGHLAALLMTPGTASLPDPAQLLAMAQEGPRAWLASMGAAGANVLLALWSNFSQLRQRSQALEQRYRDRHVLR